MSSAARQATSRVQGSRALEVLARAGFAASGLIHLVLGALTIQVALHGRSEESDQSGALARISGLPGGAVILWICVVGMFGLALWLVTEAVLGIGGSSKKRWARSVVSAGKAVAYLGLGATALTFARGGSSSSTSSTRRASSTLLSLPGGQILLALLGLAAIAVGAYFVVKGVRQGFTEDITVPGGRARTPVLALGTAGYVAKGVAVVVVGVLFVVAAVQVDPQQASGLDGALRALADLPFGQVLLIAVGVGLIAFGLYTFVRARYAHL